MTGKSDVPVGVAVSAEMLGDKLQLVELYLKGLPSNLARIATVVGDNQLAEAMYACETLLERPAENEIRLFADELEALSKRRDEAGQVEVASMLLHQRQRLLKLVERGQQPGAGKPLPEYADTGIGGNW